MGPSFPDMDPWANLCGFTRSGEHYALILDMGGHRPLSHPRRVLRASGALVLVGAEGGNRLWGGTDRWIQAMLLSPFVGHKLRSLSSNPNQKYLLFLKELIEAGKLMPVIDWTYSLSEVPNAIGIWHQVTPWENSSSPCEARPPPTSRPRLLFRIYDSRFTAFSRSLTSPSLPSSKRWRSCCAPD